MVWQLQVLTKHGGVLSVPFLGRMILLLSEMVTGPMRASSRWGDFGLPGLLVTRLSQAYRSIWVSVTHSGGCPREKQGFL